MAYNVQFAFFFALAYLNVYRINVKKKKKNNNPHSHAHTTLEILTVLYMEICV